MKNQPTRTQQLKAELYDDIANLSQAISDLRETNQGPHSETWRRYQAARASLEAHLEAGG